ncbi:MAG: lipoprotein-releasing ABC transporter permease subunit [candidate division Zixibacteria bacterium]|nr:lipoprotein-releasing ABC transporter permease subunit [candidate division Zixibacteria bacterium]MBU1469194.1 lipoprotein-releasing ABC transporter permease subunit [candidate division Zixibacteria bacterium]MBU2626568.1 lipoprotein-releasing ABC transporter permease subunit [candidate division Zixibacteria bacterium]
MRYELFIATRYMKSRQREGFISVISFITITGITIGVAALVTVLSMMNGFESEVRERIVGTLAHISIFTFDDVGIQETDKLLEEVRKVDRVVAAAPFVYYKASISSAKENDGTMVRGIDPNLERGVSNLQETITRGDLNLDTLESGLPGIVLGETLAERLGVTVGSRVVLMSLKDMSLVGGVTGMKMPKVAQFTVSGIFSNGLHEYDASLSYISITSAQKLFKLEQKVTGIQIKIDDMYKSAQVAAALNRDLGFPYFATDWTEMHKNLYSWMKLEKYGMFLGFALIIAVAAFNIISTLVMLVLEKKREIAILKSMGALRKSISRIFVYQGLATGTIGTVLGITLAVIVCLLQQEFGIISLPADIYFISKLPVRMEPLDFVVISATSILLSFLAALYPAHRAGRLYPVEILRYE